METQREKLAIFFDHANLSSALRDQGVALDHSELKVYECLRDYISEGRFLVEAFIYFPILPNKQSEARRSIDTLQEMGFFVRGKLGKQTEPGKHKCNVDVEMAIDILRFVHQSRLDIACLVAGDGDMVPLVQEVRFSGIRCEVASTTASMAKELRLAANGFISLDQFIADVGLKTATKGKGK